MRELDARIIVGQRISRGIQFRPLFQRVVKRGVRINVFELGIGLRLLGQVQFKRVSLRIAIGADGEPQCFFGQGKRVRC